MKKKNLTKRGLAALVALAMCFGMLNLSAFAAEEYSDPTAQECVHTWEFDKTIQEATCTENRVEQHQCRDEQGSCGEIKEVTVEGTMLEADFSGGRCEESGNGTHTIYCSNCEGVADGHSKVESCGDWDGDGQCDGCGAELVCDHRGGNHEDESQHEAPTCTEKGQQVYVCDKCGGVVENKEIPALGHECGDFRWDNAQHWSECNRCYEAIGGKKDHEWKEVSREEATCTEPGEIKYECGVPNCNASCDEEILSKGHSTEIVVENEPTCTEKGNEHEVCTVCGVIVENKEIPALGHECGSFQWDDVEHWSECARCHQVIGEKKDHEWKEASRKDPTCTEPGEIKYECSVPNCNASYDEEIPSKGHFTTIVVDNEPTCTEKGNEHEECTVCGSIVESKEIPALGHELEPILQGATCTDPGLTGVKCTRPGCGYRAEVSADAIGHDYKIIEQIEGDSENHLLICGNDTSHTQQKAHAYGAWETVRAATATEDGEEQHVCAGCGYVQTRPIQATGSGDDGNTQPSPIIPDGDDDGDDTPPSPVIPDGDDDDGDDTQPSPVIPDGDDDDGDDTQPSPATPDGDATTPGTGVPMTDAPEVTIPDADVPLADVPEVTVPDADVPLADVPEVTVPDEEVPLADIPEVEIPEEEVPLANIPEVDILDGEVPLVDIPDENIPLADVPKTGDLSYIWGILTLISGACMAWLALEEKKRTEK